ncbi:hypothetical protein EHI8A_003480 [Entamoeba histolytica HM-1:IMSS-B]|uniref:FHA domain-containing protein n=6 Tax=Entamoeba histolytica TaxID=5759 RepID=C4LZV0_ENTH1|nr:hypothetical protein EHI_194370 [Entamoeba histolytica HM-1:IMSS]EMD47789.1 Hypothetical protein EHI5A_012020 [Entamoeba histolytica KU27]EMH74937.1 hypothetical protein EHI8A_003480 [Entamoeba histolytica HM-1:IMSS-B]EMS14014.1 hypothetical protein KM1_013610 [Entamoeba histolytica HM-3:IMSS]ENY64537.1 hypothetical protein EHI7A_005120 [Entamoeba histolytica HM-1:IMSS-A]BAN40119.1 hypothetical protein [Entamoeba histolytica]|eukprot:XP_654702.2 hypothetical protein EHI_194370 [Entamoeba histolytica HM-1:IMSS]
MNDTTSTKDEHIMSPSKIAIKQNFSQMDYHYGCSCYIAKLEESKEQQRLYFKPEKEYGIGSHSLCSIRLTPNAEPLIALFQVNLRGDVSIIPRTKKTSIKINGNNITTATKLNNFDELDIGDLHFQYIVFYENIKYQNKREFNEVGNHNDIIRNTLTKFFIKENYKGSDISPFVNVVHASTKIDEALLLCLNKLKELTPNPGNDKFIGLLRQMTSQLFCISSTSIGFNVSYYESDVYNFTNKVKKTPSRKINFDEMQDSEDPFEAFKKANENKQEKTLKKPQITDN